MTTADCEGKRKGNNCGDPCRYTTWQHTGKYNLRGQIQEVIFSISFSSIRENYPLNKPEKPLHKKRFFNYFRHQYSHH